MHVPHHFTRFAAIDWSGGKGARHPGIAVAICAEGDAAPLLVEPPEGRMWSRDGVRRWLLARADQPVLVGFDFSFAPPLLGRGSYLPGEAAPDTARAFWRYVDAECDDADLGAASFLERRRGHHFYLGASDGRKSDFLHHRVCELTYNATGGGKASTVYDAIGAAQVAKASFSGMRLLHHLGEALPVWPFSPPPRLGALVVEIYTSIAARAAGVPRGRSKIRDAQTLDTALAVLDSEPHGPLERYTDHATDVIVTSAWLRKAARRQDLWAPPSLSRDVAQTEGWTFGVV